MEICTVGAGYVGLTTSALLSDLGHNVHVIDKDISKIEILNKGKSPIHEPGLEELLVKNHQCGRLVFSDDREACILNSPILLIAVGTPSKPNGDSDLTAIKKVFEHIAMNITSYKLIIVKSTVPPGSNEWFHQYLLDHGVDEKMFDIVSNPEFLREGTAVYDSFHPDKVVVGSKSKQARDEVKHLYKSLQAPYIETSLTGAELVKYASNAFLATKISFVNEFARICDGYNVNILDITKAIGLDPRIGPHFLQSGLGYGGSCFPKDLDAITYAAHKKRIKTSLLDAVKKVNHQQVDIYVNKLAETLNGFKGKQITVWGLSFKPNTDDIRDSRAIMLCERLIEKGCTVIAYDPKATSHNNHIKEKKDLYTAVHQSDALIVATEWDEFNQADWHKVNGLMKGNIVVDGRNSLDQVAVRASGLRYLGVARP